VEKFAMSSLKGSEYGSELANSMPEGEKKDLLMNKVQEIRLATSSVLDLDPANSRWTSMEPSLVLTDSGVFWSEEVYVSHCWRRSEEGCFW